MLFRQILTELQTWAAGSKRKPLIIRGARQVGKSTVVQLLADLLGLNCVILDMERHPEYAEFFASNEPQMIIQLIALRMNQPIIPGKTLLFIDEVQATPRVLACLRYFYEELPELHIICAGSLLEFALEHLSFSMPVGRIEYVYLGPMNFEEFLSALGEEGLCEFLSSHKTIPELIHKKLLDLLKIFLIVGGMPEAVQNYVSNRDFMSVERVKHSILETYQDDFAKYGSSENMLRSIFEKISGLITKKIKYSEINPHIKSNVVSKNINQLATAKVITKIYHSACNGIPLGAQINEKIFKLIFLDVGLLSTQLGLSYLDLHNIDELNMIHQGILSEQFIGQHLLYLRPYYEPPQLYYWVREEKSSQAEIDYVITHRQKIIPIEVKAGKTGRLKSLHIFMKEKSVPLGVKISSQLPGINQVAEGNTIISMPLYMINQLRRVIDFVL